MTNITCSRIDCIYNDENEKYRGECQRTEVKLIDKQVLSRTSRTGKVLLLECVDYEGVENERYSD